MTGFFNFIRESDDARTIENKPLQGLVVNNNDKTKMNPDGSMGPGGNQQIQVRLHVIDDDIPDANLPWYSPDQLSAYSGSANIGDHGPIPQKGTNVWVSFPDKSHYFGTYGGAVSTVTNQIPEFAGQTPKPVNLPGGQQYNYQQNYPTSNGSIDGSGSFGGSDEHTDVVANVHVTGTGHAVDGKGNTFTDINGGVTTSNPNAMGVFPTGANVRVFGNLSLFVSGSININCTGNVSVNNNGTTTIQSVGQTQVLSNGEIDVMSSSSTAPLNISSNFMIRLQAPTILVSTPPTTGDGKPPIDVPTVPSQTAPTPRPRPNPTTPPNEEQYP